MKKYLALFIMVLFISAIPVFNWASADEKEQPLDYTHTVMVEVGTATWCPYCHYTNLVMHGIYSSGNYDFEYAEMVTDKNSVAYQRMNQDYNQHYYPTSFFDGGYEILVGGYQNWAPYTSRLNSSGARTVPDIYASMNVLWLGNAQINVDIDIQNNDTTQYDGHIRAFVVEITSRWNDYYGDPYHHGFLGFAFDQDITIPAGSTFSASTIWDGASAGYPDIVMSNIQVILVVYNATAHLKYSDPPDNTYPFYAYYVDETVAAYPTADNTPPQISNVQANPSIQDMYGYVNITAEVTDNSGVDVAKARVWYPDGTIVNATMTNIAGTDIYYYNTTYSLPGNYVFNIWARDVNGNVNNSCCPSYFYINDILPPEITSVNAMPSIQDFGGYVNITAEVTDNVGLNVVKVNISLPDGSCMNETMTNIAGTDIYYYNTTYTMGGTYTFYIYGEDLNGNHNISLPSTFEILGLQYTFYLLEGWNLITLPVENDYTASSLLADIPGCNIILRWNASVGDFDLYAPGVPNDFAIEDGHGYLVAVDNDTTFFIEGNIIESVSVPLSIGWNMLGWFRSMPTNASSLLNSIPGCTIVLKWNASVGDFDLYVPNSPNNFNVQQGDGFLVAVNQESIWHG
ncbi:MAG TPA: hypothetical protein ENI53_03070 [Thermoplasmatales archaeon]|nr:hypothetical protein [Thermoplasmatales archaeon]